MFAVASKARAVQANTENQDVQPWHRPVSYVGKCVQHAQEDTLEKAAIEKRTCFVVRNTAPARTASRQSSLRKPETALNIWLNTKLE